MRTVTEIDKEIEELQEKLTHIAGRPTEVYSRIVGYYRSLKNWNLGKREEYSHRVMFDMSAALFADATEKTTGEAKAAPVNKSVMTAARPETDPATPVEYIYFFRQTCPNCPPVRSTLARIGLPGTEIDVDTQDGTRLALEHGIYATPTVVFFDSKHEEVHRASSIGQLNELKIPQPA